MYSIAPYCFQILPAFCEILRYAASFLLGTVSRNPSAYRAIWGPLPTKLHLNANLKRAAGAEMGAAERIAEVVGEPFTAQIQNRSAQAHLVATRATQPGSRHHVEELPRPHAARLEVDELAARTLHELVDLLFIDFERRAAFVAAAERRPEPASRMIVTGAERRHVPLIVIGNEPRAVGNLDHLVFEEKSSGDRAEIHHARVRVADIAGRTAPARQVEPHVDAVCFPARDRIGHEKRRAEQHVRVAHAFNAAAPVRHV